MIDKNKEIKEKVEKLLLRLKFPNKNIIDKFLLDEIIERTSYLDINVKLNERIFHIINDLFEVQKCKIQDCKNKVSFNSLVKGYFLYCSSKCSYIDNAKKIKETYKRKTGFDNPSKNPEVIKKIKDTFIKKYGVSNASKVSEFQDKKKITCRKKYGVDFAFQADEVKDNIRKSVNEKWGADNISKTEYFSKKFKETCNKRYNTEHPMRLKDISSKVKETMLEKYGVISNLNLPDTKLKALKNSKKTRDKKIIDFFNNFENIEFIKSYKNGKYLIKCNKCNNEFEVYHQYAEYRIRTSNKDLCTICYPSSWGISLSEIELQSFIEQLGIEISKNNRSLISPLELDIYIPSKNIAIEFDGLYWHSEVNNIGKDYHLNKTKLCEEKGIRLIHIFEDEWIFKKDIVKTRLAHILGVSNNERIHARKCKIKQISSSDSNDFLNKFHIQGGDNALIRLGAFFNNELVGVMTFSHGSIAKGSKLEEGVWELNRFCIDFRFNIPGIASKLFNYFKKNFEWREIFSYADRRWSNGGLYNKLGFGMERFTSPNYWYIKDFIRTHRFGLRKRVDEPKDIPEYILRLNEGYYRIWDCGSYKFKINRHILEQI